MQLSQDAMSRARAVSAPVRLRVDTSKTSTAWTLPALASLLVMISIALVLRAFNNDPALDGEDCAYSR